jgi:hypothetical protein
MYPVVHVWCAHSLPAGPRVGASARPRERGGAGTHSFLRLGQSAAAGSAASSVKYATLRASCAAVPGGSGPPLTARRSAARASHARAGLGRRPTTGNAAASNAARLGPSARRGSATRRSAAPAPPRTRTAAAAAGRDAQFLQELEPAEPLGERPHLRGGDGPAVHNAPLRPAPAARRWADVGSNGPKPWKVIAHALNSHPHA